MRDSNLLFKLSQITGNEGADAGRTILGRCLRINRSQNRVQTMKACFGNEQFRELLPISVLVDFIKEEMLALADHIKRCTRLRQQPLDNSADPFCMHRTVLANTHMQSFIEY